MRHPLATRLTGSRTILAFGNTCRTVSRISAAVFVKNGSRNALPTTKTDKSAKRGGVSGWLLAVLSVLAYVGSFLKPFFTTFCTGLQFHWVAHRFRVFQ